MEPRGLFTRRAICCILAVIVLTCFSVPYAAEADTSPLRFGATLSFSGKYQEPSQMIRAGYELWVDQINRKGGLLGRPVELLIYDDRSELVRVEQLYRQLLSTDRVDFVLSPYGSPATIAASRITEKHGYVMIACAAGSEAVYGMGNQYLFGVYAPAGRFSIGFLDLLARRKTASVGIVYEDSVFHRSIYEGVKKWTELFGMEISFHRKFSEPGRDYGEILTALEQNPLEALIFTSYPPEAHLFIDQMQKSGIRPQALFFTICSIHPDFYKKTGPFAENIFGPSQWEPIKRIPFPGTEKFIDDFEKFTGKVPSYHACAAYSSGEILARAIEKTASLDHRNLRDYISRLDTVTIMGRFKVDHTGRQIGHNPLLIQWQNGKKEIVYPSKLQTAEPVFEH